MFTANKQYHSQRVHTTKGVEIGSMLKVTADGEDELPPGETPGASRSASRRNSGELPQVDGEPFADAWVDRGVTERQLDKSKGKHGEEQADGHWVSGMDPSPSRPAANHARFSSFRNSAHSAQSDSSHHMFSLHQSQSNIPEGRVDETGQHGDAAMASSTAATKQDSMETSNPAEPSRRGASDDEPQDTHEKAQQRWSNLRSRVLPGKNAAGGGSGSGNKVTALSHTAIASLPVTTELLAGQLPVMILKTWMDRDDEGNRAVPVLLGNLRFRVGDSVGLRPGRQTGKEMFKVECEYGDGIVKWVSRVSFGGEGGLKLTAR